MCWAEICEITKHSSAISGVISQGLLLQHNLNLTTSYHAHTDSDIPAIVNISRPEHFLLPDLPVSTLFPKVCFPHRGGF